MRFGLGIPSWSFKAAKDPRGEAWSPILLYAAALVVVTFLYLWDRPFPTIYLHSSHRRRKWAQGDYSLGLF